MKKSPYPIAYLMIISYNNIGLNTVLEILQIMTETRNEILKRIKSGRVEVLGLGISNIPLCRYLCDKKANVYGRDKKTAELLGETYGELITLGVKTVLGEHYMDGIGGDEPQNTVIFRAPGIRPDVKEIEQAVSRGAILSSEMELFFEITPATVIGITGSDGKTTTTTLIGEFLREQFKRDNEGCKVYVGGNIGEPLLPKADMMHSDDIAVVELSSFQLMTMKRSPDRSVITNISENHLNWHTDMNEYIQAKKNIYGHATCGYLTLNADNGITADLGTESDLPITYFSSTKVGYENIVPEGKKHCCAIYIRNGMIVFSDGIKEEQVLTVGSIKIPGKHNIENYMTAIAATWGIVSKDVIKHIAETFGGVEHRCELVRELNGIRYYNSSIDSTPTRTEAALSAFNQKVVIICGGYDKKIKYEPLAVSLCRRAKKVILTGATAEKIKTAILNCPEYSIDLFEIIERKDFSDAVLAAAEAAVPGDVVMLSPACASFDAFANFEERGRCFKSIINSL